MTDKMMLTLQDLHVLAATAERNGTQRNFLDVALQWAAGAQAEIERLREHAVILAETAREVERERSAKKPLTAQQLDRLIEAHVGGAELEDGEYSAMVMFAAAVERAHGIGA